MGAPLDPATAVVAEARPRASVACSCPRLATSRIDTFVVLMMEEPVICNSLTTLGWLPGADGRQAGPPNHAEYPHGKTYPTHRLVNNYQGCGSLDPDHPWNGGRTSDDLRGG